MDQFGVPKKVNRHVLKALKKIYSSKSHKGQENDVKFGFSEVYSEVERSMKNLKPVKDLKSLVLRSLKNNNFDNSGFSVQSRKKSIQEHTLHSSPKVSRTFFPKANFNDEEPRSLNLKRKLSGDSMSDEDLTNHLKRMKGKKELKRENPAYKLPRHRIVRDQEETALTPSKALIDTIPFSVNFEDLIEISQLQDIVFLEPSETTEGSCIELQRTSSKNIGDSCQ